MHLEIKVLSTAGHVATALFTNSWQALHHLGPLVVATGGQCIEEHKRL